MQFVRKCIICEKVFTAQRRNACCCSYECKKRRWLDNAKRARIAENEKKSSMKNKVPHKDLKSINEAAKLAGMTYGQYVAKMGL